MVRDFVKNEFFDLILDEEIELVLCWDKYILCRIVKYFVFFE